MDVLVLAIHGLSIRSSHFADPLFRRLQNRLNSTAPALNVQFLPIYWGDIAEEELKSLRLSVTSTKIWKKLWYRPLRERLLLPFLGDLANYTSRHAGLRVIRAICEIFSSCLSRIETDMPIYLVTHSLGTVILFDLLFAERWNDDDFTEVRDLRKALYGVKPHKKEGAQVAGIYTMGSPLAFFSLLEGSHNVQKKMTNMLSRIPSLEWHNFIHPGDPFVCPFGTLLSDVKIREHVIEASNIPFVSELMGLLLLKEAHTCYWSNGQVAQTIADSIARTSNKLVLPQGLEGSDVPPLCPTELRNQKITETNDTPSSDIRNYL
jgi:hypothetical protein